LQEAGGFELLILKSGRRGQASLISASVGPLPVTDLKHLTTGKIYIRPLQQDLSMSEQSGGLNYIRSAFFCTVAFSNFKLNNFYSISIFFIT
jgi:hypothetical protein